MIVREFVEFTRGEDPHRAMHVGAYRNQIDLDNLPTHGIFKVIAGTETDGIDDCIIFVSGAGVFMIKNWEDNGGEWARDWSIGSGIPAVAANLTEYKNWLIQNKAFNMIELEIIEPDIVGSWDNYKLKNTNEAIDFKRGEEPHKALQVGDHRDFQVGDYIRLVKPVYFNNINFAYFYTAEDIGSKLPRLLQKGDVYDMMYHGADAKFNVYKLSEPTTFWNRNQNWIDRKFIEEHPDVWERVSVNETIEFKRGEDPYGKLNIGNEFQEGDTLEALTWMDTVYEQFLEPVDYKNGIIRKGDSVKVLMIHFHSEMGKCFVVKNKYLQFALIPEDDAYEYFKKVRVDESINEGFSKGDIVQSTKNLRWSKKHNSFIVDTMGLSLIKDGVKFKIIDIKDGEYIIQNKKNTFHIKADNINKYFKSAILESMNFKRGEDPHSSLGIGIFYSGQLVTPLYDLAWDGETYRWIDDEDRYDLGTDLKSGVGYEITDRKPFDRYGYDDAFILDNAWVVSAEQMYSLFKKYEDS